MMHCEMGEDYEGDVVARTNGKWNEEDSARIKHITHLNTVSLQLENNSRPSLLMEIAHIHFLHLTELWIPANNLSSIETLPAINMPHIQQLYLSNNHIYSIQAIRKGHWPSLHTLSLFNNYSVDGGSLTEGHLPRLGTLYLSWDLVRKDKNNFYSFSFVSKLETTILSTLQMRAGHLCLQRSIKVLKQKWQVAKIF